MAQIFGVLSFFLLAGCAPSANQAQKKDEKKDAVKAASQEPTMPGPGEVMQRFDINKDKKPDLWKFFVEKPDPKDNSKKIRELVRIEIDLNGDGRIDVQRFYQNGVKVRERFDLDYDGKFDLVNHYNQGYVYKQELFQRSKTTPDLIKHYELVEGKGKKKKVRLSRKERDQNLDGKPDYWEYWENGMLDRIGRDTDYDGKVDVWERPQSN
ncbi:MAG: hypothetical protein H6728_09240 [Myxococcales bacterium]|nr:hypothetical protein [Myxococcales bacterium]MCB9643248.1 hypothetical protein [Myxococcales bacterium]